MKKNCTKLLGGPNDVSCHLRGWPKFFTILLTLLFVSISNTTDLSAQCSAISNIKFVANNPLDTKVHYGDGSKDSVLTSLEPQDYVCFDTVPFLVLLTINANAACQDYTVELPLSWLCNTTGQDGIGATKIVGFQLNDASDTAVKNLDGDEDIEFFDEITDGTPLEGNCELTGVFRVSGLDPGDQVVVRVDVLLDCKPSTPTGNIQAALGATQAIKIIDASDPACLCQNLQGGNQTIPWKVGLPECEIACSITEKTDVTCNGGADGSATVSVDGAFGEVTYEWSNGATTATIEDLSAGTYTVTVVDFLNCGTICEVTIEESSTLECTVTKVQDVSCKGGNDGIATVEAEGGDGNYIFDWGQDVDPNALSAGTYTVTVTDGNECTSTCSVTINEPAEAVSCKITKIQDVSCKGGNDGMASVSATGGDGNYTFKWENDVDPNALSAGTYKVTVTDGNKCASICEVTIEEPAKALTCEITKIQDVSCKDGNDGMASVSAEGGDGNYTFDWGQGVDPNALSLGVYTVTVTDGNGCTSTCDVLIKEPLEGLTCDIEKIQDVSCKGGNDGKASVSASGGDGNYTFDWGQDVDPDALSAGLYEVTVTDGKGCTSTCEVLIKEPLEGLTCDITKIQDVSCKGGNDGKAIIEVKGGDGNYTINWGQDVDPDALSAGTYKVTVSDGKGCTSYCEVTINAPLVDLTCEITKIQDVSCKGGNDGMASVSADGGDGEYTFNWGMDVNPDALPAGTYEVTVTDGSGCTSFCSVTIKEPVEGLSCEVVKVQDVSCNGGKDGKATVKVTGGTGEYTIDWGDTNPEALSAGTYTVTVSDENECITTCSVTIEEPAPLEVDAGDGGTICEGGSFQLNGSASGGTGELTYAWLPSGNLNDPTVLNPEIIAPLVNTEYTLQVTDENGCTAVDKVSIIVLQSPKASLTMDVNQVCYGETTELSYTITLPDGTGCEWILKGPGVELSSTNGDEPTGTITVGEGLDPGLYSFDLDIKCTTLGCAVDPQTIDLLVEKCAEDCTWTPGFWKNHPAEICGLLGGEVVKNKGKRTCEGDNQNIGFILCDEHYTLSASDISCLFDYSSNLRGNKEPEACSDNPGIKAIAEHFAQYPNGVTLLHHILAAQMNLLYNGANFGEIEMDKFICVEGLEGVDIANIFNGEFDEEANEVAAIQFCIPEESSSSDLSKYIEPLTTYNECNGECGLPSEQEKADEESEDDESEEENEEENTEEGTEEGGEESTEPGNGQGNGNNNGNSNSNGQNTGQGNAQENNPNENSEKHFQRIQKLKLYPNPVREDLMNITFKLEVERPVIVRIIDMTGDVKIEQELTVKLGDNEAQIDISVLPAGLYMLQLTDGMLVNTKRFMRFN